MNLLLGVTNMIIKKLEVKNLYGMYDYKVSFNNDLTFIFGDNGCGKTTILDIVSSIVTGKIYNLFEYSFDEIILYYYKYDYYNGIKSKTDKIKTNTVKIEYDENGSYNIHINDVEDDIQISEVIEDIRKINEIYTIDEEDDIDRMFINNYKFPKLLRKTFNYIYLPLSRNSQYGVDMTDIIGRRHNMYRIFSRNELFNKNYLNESLRYVEEIVRTGLMKINSEENKINMKFRSNVFTSSLTVKSNYSFKEMFSTNNDKIDYAIEKNKSEYIRILKSIGEWNEDAKKRIEDFFEEYISLISNINKNNNNLEFIINLIIMHTEFERIKEIATQAQGIETEKNKIRAPINLFEKTVNKFLSIGEDKKTVCISNEGKIIIETEYPRRMLSLYDLSSGEKQIIIIFACLIFGLSSGKRGIYIIDEPEASLHLSWQRKFVESIKNVNNDIQLIFATHSPEIISRYQDKAVRLKKKITPNYIKKDYLECE